MDHSANNSGSMQSSSCGEEQDYDSRNESISPLFNSSSFANSANNPYPPPPQSQSQPQHTFFDPQLQQQGNNNLHHPFSHSPASNQLDLVWSRSEPNYSSLGNLTPLSSSFPPTNHSQLGLSQGPLQSLDGNTPRVALNSVSHDHHQNQATNVGKSSRKRTRASRRAPTTVLTTDASNFRQMVQEFTGIPAPPFSASSSPYARRLDLFGGGGLALRSGLLDGLGPLYPFRPSAQKVQQNPLVSSTNSSTSSPSMMLNNNTMAATCNNNDDANAFSNSYQMNMQNPIFTSTFQSLLQSSGSHLGTKSQGIGSMDHELGMGQQHVSATSLGEFSMQVGGSTTNNNLTKSIWGEDQEGANGDQGHGGPQNGTGIYKMNGSRSVSDFRSDKRMENVSSRNEGTVDSWICPSD